MTNREIKKAFRFLYAKGLERSKLINKCTTIYFKLVDGEKIRIYVIDEDDIKFGAMPLKKIMPKLIIYEDKIFSHRDIIMVGLENTTIDIKGDD